MTFLIFQIAVLFTQRFFDKYVLLATTHISKLAAPDNGPSHAAEIPGNEFIFSNF